MYKWMVRVTSVGSAPSSLLSGRFMWVDLQLEASLETARINVIQWQLHSDEGLPLWRVHAHIAGVSPPPHTVLAVHRPLGAQRVTATPQPFCRESIADRAASDTAG